MAIPYKIQILKSPNLSMTHFSISIPEALYNAKAIIFDARGENEQIKFLNFVKQALAEEKTEDEYWTNSFTAKVIKKDGRKMLEIFSRGTGYNEIQQILLEDFENILTAWIQTRRELNENTSRERLKHIIEDGKMVVLPSQFTKSDALVRVSNKNSYLWQIEIGPWYQDGQPYQYLNNFLTKEEILMDKKDLFRFALEIKRILQNKTIKKELLSLTFRQNEPQLKINMRWTDEENRLHKGLKGMVEFMPAINVEYLVRAYGREEDEIYRKGHTGTIQYYYPEELEKFAEALEQEAKQ